MNLMMVDYSAIQSQSWLAVEILLATIGLGLAHLRMMVLASARKPFHCFGHRIHPWQLLDSCRPLGYYWSLDQKRLARILASIITTIACLRMARLASQNLLRPSYYSAATCRTDCFPFNYSCWNLAFDLLLARMVAFIVAIKLASFIQNHSLNFLSSAYYYLEDPSCCQVLSICRLQSAH